MEKIDYVGLLSQGHDGELYIITEDGVEHDISQELVEKGMCRWLGDKTEVRLIIEKIII